jgi:hypothetical protein
LHQLKEKKQLKEEKWRGIRGNCTNQSKRSNKKNKSGALFEGITPAKIKYQWHSNHDGPGQNKRHTGMYQSQDRQQSAALQQSTKADFLIPA